MSNHFNRFIFILTILSLMGFAIIQDTQGSMFDSDGGDFDYQRVQLLSPLGGDILPAGTIQRISYTSTDVDYIKIEYSVNNGKDWTVVVKNRKIDAPFDDYRWQVPCTLSNSVKIKISDAYDPFYDDKNLNTFSIVDTTAPSITTSLGVENIWPPNNELTDVGFKYEVTDNCDSNPRVFIKVTSDEPVASSGNSDSDSVPDARIIAGGRVLVKAERSENGDGRVYVITVSSTDASGNTATSSASVKVNISKDKDAKDSGQFYDATVIN
ncbi:MAG: hypothetical protein R6W88_15555 [Desulfobacterales bacterium]